MTTVKNHILYMDKPKKKSNKEKSSTGSNLFIQPLMIFSDKTVNKLAQIKIIKSFI